MQECSKSEDILHLKREGTFHRGHRLHSVYLTNSHAEIAYLLYAHGQEHNLR